MLLPDEEVARPGLMRKEMAKMVKVVKVVKTG